MFRKFLETWHTFSSPKVIFLIFGVRRENFLMGLKINFKFETSASKFKVLIDSSRPFFSCCGVDGSMLVVGWE